MSVDGFKSTKYYKVETDHLKTKYLNANAGNNNTTTHGESVEYERRHTVRG